MENKYSITSELDYENIKVTMRAWTAATKAENFVVGVSGGKDSTVTAMLLAKIFGKERVYGVMMPAGVQPDISDSEDVIRITGINRVIVNIGEARDSIIDQIDNVSEDTKINLPARLRMSTLFAVAQTVNGRVINTDNLTEGILGYSTFGGDNFGCFAPLGDLTVTEVRALGRYLIRESDWSDEDKMRMVNLVYKVPSDGLQPLSDEDKLGLKYGDVDDYIRENIGDDDFKKRVLDMYRANKFKSDIVRLPTVLTHYPNYIK